MNAPPPGSTHPCMLPPTLDADMTDVPVGVCRKHLSQIVARLHWQLAAMVGLACEMYALSRGWV